MTSKFWLTVAGMSLLLSLSRFAAARNPVGSKPVLSVLGVAVPKERLKYENASLRGIWSYGEVACVVKNVSKKPVTITTETAGWNVNWWTDNRHVRRVEWPCSANMPISMVLNPGETYSKNVPIVFIDLNQGQKVTFRVRFDSNPEKRAIPSYTVWSVPITTQAHIGKP